MTGCCTAQRFNRIHSAQVLVLCGMNTRGGGATPPRIPRFQETPAFGDSLDRASGGFPKIPEHAPGYFPAEHHGTAEHQDHADIRTRRGLREQWSLKSLITGARAGARGGQPRHRQLFSGGAAHG
jgi:hypothetical protein